VPKFTALATVTEVACGCAASAPAGLEVSTTPAITVAAIRAVAATRAP
jgi:hypothetical protein